MRMSFWSSWPFWRLRRTACRSATLKILSTTLLAPKSCACNYQKKIIQASCDNKLVHVHVWFLIKIDVLEEGGRSVSDRSMKCSVRFSTQLRRWSRFRAPGAPTVLWYNSNWTWRGVDLSVAQPITSLQKNDYHKLLIYNNTIRLNCVKLNQIHEIKWKRDEYFAHLSRKKITNVKNKGDSSIAFGIRAQNIIKTIRIHYQIRKTTKERKRWTWSLRKRYWKVASE